MTNPRLPAEYAARAKDLTPAWHRIIEGWAKNNEEMFSAASGQSLSGMQVDADVFWEPVTEDYFKSKSRTYPDILMVRTGLLESALTDPDNFTQVLMPDHAFFGTPTNDQAYNEALWNWEKRQVINLSEDDQALVINEIYQYIRGIGPYVDIQGLS